MNLTYNFAQLLQDYPPQGNRSVLCHHHENKHRQQYYRPKTIRRQEFTNKVQGDLVEKLTFLG